MMAATTTMATITRPLTGRITTATRTTTLDPLTTTRIHYSCYYGYPYGYGNYNYPYEYSNSYYGNNYYSPPQYQLTVTTDPAGVGTASGTGTYMSGSSATFTVNQTTVQTSANTRYVFSHWSGDYSGVGASGTLTMNGAMQVTAVYQLQYHLDVGVQPLTAPLPQGVGWYKRVTL